MNQILFLSNKTYFKKKKRTFKLILFFSIIIMVCAISYYIYLSYLRNKNKYFSDALLYNFNVEHIYSDSNYSLINLNENSDFIVIGLIEIPSINIKYPILSEINDEFLKIAPCRFYGPYPNEVGNLCIAGHNYDDNRFFGNLNKVNLEDIIYIYDYTNTCVCYHVYDKFEISKNDVSCTNQFTDKKEITLVTCNNYNKNRLVIKAKE